jgi:uncharacterized protein with HEPN domain
MKDPRFFLKHALEAVRAARRYGSDRQRSDLDSDELLRDAIVRQLSIVGEAMRHVPAEARAEFEQLPWREVTGMRNRLVHEYFRVDLDVVWAGCLCSCTNRST